MRALVTGGRGKVGRHVVTALLAAGHEPVVTDLERAAYGVAAAGDRVRYIRADLTDFGQVAAIVSQVRPDVIVHTAGIPAPGGDAPQVVFATNCQTMFNVAEAVVALGIPRLVYLSSETVPGFVTAERPFVPDYLPVDEEHPVRPQDAYALSKAVGEQIADATVRRADVSAVSIRASVVLDAGDYQGFVAALQRSPVRPFPNQWSYVDVEDLADLVVLAAQAGTAGHEVVYAAQPDNFLGKPLAALVAGAYGDGAPPLATLDRPDASAISCAKARTLFGWNPTRSWRDHVDAG
jgi:UDP-glucose 4-epimerase